MFLHLARRKTNHFLPGDRSSTNYNLPAEFPSLSLLVKLASATGVNVVFENPNESEATHSHKIFMVRIMMYIFENVRSLFYLQFRGFEY